MYVHYTSLVYIHLQAVVLSQQGASGSPLAETVRKTVEMFLQRMHEVNNSGRSIATDPVVLSLYQNLNALQPQLLQQIDEVQQKKSKYAMVWGSSFHLHNQLFARSQARGCPSEAQRSEGGPCHSQPDEARPPGEGAATREGAGPTGEDADGTEACSPSPAEARTDGF